MFFNSVIVKKTYLGRQVMSIISKRHDNSHKKITCSTQSQAGDQQRYTTNNFSVSEKISK